MSASATGARATIQPGGRTCSRRRTPGRISVIALGFILGAALQPVSAQPQAQGPQITANYRDSDIRVVIEQVSQVIGKPIIVDPRVRAQVTVLSTAPMSPDAFYQLFLSMLEVHGYQALTAGNAIEIVPYANARFGQVVVRVQVNLFVLHRAPEPVAPAPGHFQGHRTLRRLQRRIV